MSPESSSAARPKPLLTIGGVDVSDHILRLETRSHIGTTSSATCELSLSVLSDTSIDYFADVRIGVMHEGRYYSRLVGVVDRVTPSQDQVTITFTSGTELHDTTVPGFEYINLSTAETVWTIARSAGLTENRLTVDGIADIPTEEVRVAIPLEGVTVDSIVDIGDIKLVPKYGVDWAVDAFQDSSLAQQFRAHKSFVLVTQRERTLYRAEQHGLAMAELAAAWIATRLRYGAALLPGNAIQNFEREQTRAIPRVAGISAVRALPSGRQWIRVPEFDAKHVLADMSRLSGSIGEFSPPSISSTDQEAFLSFWRAVESRDPLGAVVALWDSIEFYVGGTQAKKIFKGVDLQRLKSEAPSWLSNEQRHRYISVMDMMNNAPLMHRLRIAIKKDGVPIADDEFEILTRLRRVRNPAQHGKARNAPRPDDLRKALSIVARLLIYRSFSTGQHPDTTQT